MRIDHELSQLVDPDDREMIISCGAALYHLRLAANHFSIADEVQLLPDKNNNPDLLARISLKDDDKEPLRSKLSATRHYSKLSPREGQTDHHLKTEDCLMTFWYL
jgi:hypothetical protein